MSTRKIVPPQPQTKILKCQILSFYQGIDRGGHQVNISDKPTTSTLGKNPQQLNKGIRDAGSTADFRTLFEIFEILEKLNFFETLIFF